MPNNVGRLGVVLGLNTAEFIAGIENATKKLEQFGRTVDQYARYGATALAAMSVAAIKFADDIQDVAQANDVAIDTVVKLRAALDASGGSADKAGIMLSAFTKFIDTAASGSFEAQKAFKSVGVSLKDIGTMSQEQLLGKVLSGLEQIEDTVTRNARAMDFFSKAAKGVAFDSFAQQMKNTTEVTQSQIAAIKAGAETWDNFEKIVRKIQILFAEALGPTLRAFNNQLSDQTITKISLLGDTFNFLASNISSAYKAIQSIGILLEKIAGHSLIMQTYGESKKGLDELKKLNDETDARLNALRKSQKDFDDILQGKNQGGSGRGMLGYEQYSAQSPTRETTVGIDTKAKAAEAEAKRILEERRRYTENIMKDNETAAEKRLQLSIKEMMTVRDQLDKEEAIAKIKDINFVNAQEAQTQLEKQLNAEKEIFLLHRDNKYLTEAEMQYAERILQIRTEYAQKEHQIKMELDSQQLTQKQANDLLERNNELRQRSIEQAKEVLTETRKQTEGTWTEGVGKAFDEYIKNIPTQLQLGQQAFTAVMGNMDMALQNFVRSGKFNFKDFARSIMLDMAMIQARAQMMSWMKGVWTMFGGGTPSVNLGVPSGMAMAEGGTPPVGLATLVGERGPELFVPKTSGTVIPNNQLSSVMGGGGQTVNYNGPYIASMSAIDTQSGIQFLAKNKQTIWASYQSANRSVPVSR
jgi:lambda family phage tail tape measure protein